MTRLIRDTDQPASAAQSASPAAPEQLPLDRSSSIARRGSEETSSVSQEGLQVFTGLSRQLANVPDLAWEEHPTIGVTSARRGEGVSSVAAGLAIAATSGLARPSLLIDANHESPSAADMVGGATGPGLGELLADASLSIEDCCHSTSTPDLHVLPAGTWSPDSSRNILTSRFDNVLRSISQVYQLAVFDLPIADELTECCSLAQKLDGVVLVVEAEKTPRHAVLRAKARLENSRANVIGVAVNKKPHHVPQWLYNRL